MSLASRFPSIKPSLNLDFANTKRLDPRVTFTRASAATYFDANGVMQTAAANECRLHHNPVTGECLGIYGEGAATNLLTYSEDFSNAAWTKDSCTITTNAAIAPDGTLTMDELVLSGAAGAMYTGFSGVTGTVTQSAYVKKNTADTVYFIYNSNSNKAVFNPNTGAVVSAVGGVASIEDVGNDTYRIKFTPTHATTARSYIGATGTTGESVFIWGAQLETGSRASSYIKTEASTATRAADVPVMTGTNFSDWYNQAEGTFVMEFAVNSSESVSFPLIAGDASANSAIYLTRAPGNEIIQGEIYIAPTPTSMPTIAVSSGEFATIAYAYKANDYAISTNASAVATDTTQPVPPGIDRLGLVYLYSSGGGHINGTIKRLAYYPKRLTNTELQQLSAQE